MILAILVFFLGAGAVLGGYAAFTHVPGILERRRLDQRLRDVSAPAELNPGDDGSVVARTKEGPLPGIDRILAKSTAGFKLSTLIAQSGVPTTSSSIVMLMLILGGLGTLVGLAFAPFRLLVPFIAIACAGAPIAYLVHKRTGRLRRFEEMFPEALELMSRALKAGHAFQAAMGMVGEELKEPVGPEFKKSFDQQNFGLPLRDSLLQMSERVPLLDVRFFATAVLIQRETGGNLSEILENLAHVVRERFKILRQVRVHTAHGRFTAFVLLALPAGLALALSYINPDHMSLLFEERMGQMMILLAIVMQTVGFIWIRKVIKIEV